LTPNNAFFKVPKIGGLKIIKMDVNRYDKILLNALISDCNANN